MKFQATEFKTPHEAIGHAVATDGIAVRLNGQNLVVSETDIDRLMDNGIGFAYLDDRNGTIVTIPVNP